MGKSLIIVESPSKISKIKSIMGAAYDAVTTCGHILEFDKSVKKQHKYLIDIESGFVPHYSPAGGKEEIIRKLRKAIKDADDVIICTDKDSEGEMIAWSVAYLFNLKNPKRAVFTSITKDDITKAIMNPTTINYNIVDGQKTRASLDIIIGFSLSPLLMNTFGAGMAKSAGRVQSVVVRLIADKENEVKEFYIKNDDDKSTTFKIKGLFFDSDKLKYDSKLIEAKEKKPEQIILESKDECLELLEKFKSSSFTVKTIKKKKSTRNPPPPFITSSLQQEASKKLKFSSKITMDLAQVLYQEGYITYMRTDSPELSNDAMGQIKDFVIGEYGEDYYKARNHKSKSASAQEAHEAIRPTKIKNVELSVSGKIKAQHVRLYSLIWKRCVASQMSPAIYDVMEINIAISNEPAYFFHTENEKLVFDGYLIIYQTKNKDTQDDSPSNNTKGKNEELQIGTPMEMQNITATQENKKPPPRFNESSLIGKIDVKDLGIGRPSTYASIIAKILERNYVEIGCVDGIEKPCSVITLNNHGDISEDNSMVVIGKENNVFLPTETGIMTTNFLMENFPEIMEYKFTAKMEKDIDDIASGKKKRISVLQKFYDKYEPMIREKEEEIKKQRKDIPKGDYKDPNEILIGTTEDGVEIYSTITRKGDSVVRMKTNDDEKPKYAKIEKPLSRKKITLEQAIELMSYPKSIGEIEGKPVMLCSGKFGLYITFNDKNYSSKNITDAITIEECAKIIKDKDKSNIKVFKTDKATYSIKKAKYEGSNDFIHVMKKGNATFVTIPSKYNSEEITLEQVEELVKEHSKAQPKITKKSTKANGEGRGRGGRGGRGRTKKD